MNAIQQAKATIQNLAALMRGTHHARAAFAAKRLPEVPAPRDVQLFVFSGMVHIRDADTGRVLGFRQGYVDAEQLGRDLVSGNTSAPAMAGSAA